MIRVLLLLSLAIFSSLSWSMTAPDSEVYKAEKINNNIQKYIYDDTLHFGYSVEEISKSQKRYFQNGLFLAFVNDFLATKRGTETIQRAMSRGELEAIQNSGVLSRGGRPGPHFVSDAVNSTANRARQRLALPGSPEVRVTMDVPKGVFSSPSKVKPKFNMPGGGMERTAPGHLDIPATIRRVDGL